MTRPEDALEVARAAVAAGAYDSEGPSPAPPAPDTRRKLLEWAFVEPDPGVLRSTRRYGAPITALKRVLLRALGQYNSELAANQTRFNLTLLAQLEALEERLDALERRGRGP